MHSASTFMSIISVKTNLYVLPAVILTEQLAKHAEYLVPAHLILPGTAGTSIQRSLTRYSVNDRQNDPFDRDSVNLDKLLSFL